MNLKCFLELFTITGDELENLWLRALDPKGLSLVPLPEFEEFLERIARGSMSNKPTAVSATFSKEMKRLMELEGCIAGEQRGTQSGENGAEKRETVRHIDITKLREKIKTEKAIDIEIFNQLLKKEECLFKVESVHY